MIKNPSKYNLEFILTFSNSINKNNYLNINKDLKIKVLS
jgi:hypothetical protein